MFKKNTLRKPFQDLYQNIKWGYCVKRHELLQQCRGQLLEAQLIVLCLAENIQQTDDVQPEHNEEYFEHDCSIIIPDNTEKSHHSSSLQVFLYLENLLWFVKNTQKLVELAFVEGVFLRAKHDNKVLDFLFDNLSREVSVFRVSYTTHIFSQRENLDGTYRFIFAFKSIFSIVIKLFFKNNFMQILSFVLTFFVGYAVMLFGDYVWLGMIVKRFTIREFWELIVVENDAIKINIFAWLLAWAVIVLLVLIFVIQSQYASSSLSAIWYGALIGCLSYAMYDLTNLTFLKNYSLSFTLVDIAWGTFLLACVSLAMYHFHNYFSRFL